MQRETAEDWIDFMIRKAFKNYKGRRIVIWGNYRVSDSIRNKLKEKYGIDTAFYVDSDKSKTDGKRVFPPEYLYGKSDQYYVIIPIAFYQSVREKIQGGGYAPDVDYHYFCDCVLRQELEYYEDAHGNKIIGNYQGLKFVFSGFHSVIEIGEGTQFWNTSMYIHNDTKVIIGEHTKFLESQFYIYHSAEAIFGKRQYLEKDDIVVKDEARMEIKEGCSVVQLEMIIEERAEVILSEEVCVCGEDTAWEIGKGAVFHVGSKAYLAGGFCGLNDNALFDIGKEFSINESYRIILGADTSIIIGDDCMFSYDISMRSNDGHAIFDVTTGENMNSSYSIRKERKIIVGNHVWVGEGTEILYNTQIGDGSIIGAKSLVKGKILNNCIAAGIPARVKRKNIAWARKGGAENILECGQEYIKYTKEL